MSVAVLSVGSELTRGEITNTNAAWLGRELTLAGFEVAEVRVVADEEGAIVRTLRELAAAHRVVLVTGGLGPTSDDLTAVAAARAIGSELERDESGVLAIRRRLEGLGRAVTPAHEKQADIPRGSEALPNALGTAIGFRLALGGAEVFFMPGVPREMQRMFTDQVLPRIVHLAPNDSFTVLLRTTGLGESAVAARLEGLLEATEGAVLGYRARSAEVDVKITVRASALAEARERASELAESARTRLGDIVFGEDDDALAEVTGRAIRTRGWRLSLGESCTGGLVAHMLTSHPGASDYLCGAAITYANSAKTRLLGVSEDTLRAHGAVSAEVAAAMAEGARRLCEVEVGLGVTGIAGPSGGTAKKPVGLVYWAVAHPQGTLVKERVFSGSRTEVQAAAAHAALDTLRRVAAGLPLDPPRA